MKELKAEFSSDGTKVILTCPKPNEGVEKFNEMMPSLLEAILPPGVARRSKVLQPTLIYSEQGTQSIVHFEVVDMHEKTVCFKAIEESPETAQIFAVKELFPLNAVVEK